MNSYQLKKILDNLSNEVENNEYIKGLNHINEGLGSIDQNIEKLLNVPQNEVPGVVNSTRSLLERMVQTEKREIDIFSFYEDGVKLERTLSKLRNVISPDDSYIFSSLIDAINESLLTYKNHIRSYKISTLYKLYKEASIIIEQLGIVLDAYRPLCNTLLGENSDNQIVIVFGHVTESKKYASKLTDLLDSYEEICLCCKIDISEWPLEIVKTESGSPWYIKVAGHPAIIAILTSSLTLGTTYVHDSYLKNNKIDEIPKIASAARDILNLNVELEKQGFDVGVQSEEINRLSIKLAKRLNGLVADQARLEINGNELSIPTSKEQMYLEETKKIEHLSLRNRDSEN